MIACLALASFCLVVFLVLYVESNLMLLVRSYSGLAVWVELCTWQVEKCSNEIKVPSYSILVVALLSPDRVTVSVRAPPYFVLITVQQ